MKAQLLIGCLVLLVHGCGSEVKLPDGEAEAGKLAQPDTKQGTPDRPNTEAPTPHTSMAFNSNAELPKCTAGNEGALAYLKDEAIFKTCNNGSWSEISIAGKDGDDGAAGAQGTSCTVSGAGLITCGSSTFQIPDEPNTLVYLEAEPNGQTCPSGGTRFWQYKDENGDGDYQNGEELVGNVQISCNDQNDIAASISCYGQLENSSLLFSYNANQFENGVVQASASIRDSDWQSFRSVVYSPFQNGYLDAGVSLTRDVQGAANSGWWDISLDRNSLITTIIYNDVDLTNGQITWTMPSSACTLNSYQID